MVSRVQHSSLIEGLEANLLWPGDVEGDQGSCVFCHQPFQETQRVHRFACGHLMHRRCLIDQSQYLINRGTQSLYEGDLEEGLSIRCPEDHREYSMTPELFAAHLRRAILENDVLNGLGPAYPIRDDRLGAAEANRQYEIDWEYLQTFEPNESMLAYWIENSQREFSLIEKGILSVAPLGVAATGFGWFLLRNRDPSNDCNIL